MSEQEDDRTFTPAQLRQLLAGLERDVPLLDANERLMLREILTAWKTDRLDAGRMLEAWRDRAKRKAAWLALRPLIFSIISAIGTVGTLLFAGWNIWGPK